MDVVQKYFDYVADRSGNDPGAHQVAEAALEEAIPYITEEALMAWAENPDEVCACGRTYQEHLDEYAQEVDGVWTLNDEGQAYVRQAAAAQLLKDLMEYELVEQLQAMLAQAMVMAMIGGSDEESTGFQVFGL